jgi:CubicO group peptidase (beta-lactamase class C family)
VRAARALRALAASALVLSAGCITEPDPKPGSGWRPAPIGDGWTVATPEQVGLDARSVEAAYVRFHSDREFLNAIGFVLVKDGRLVGEGYSRAESDRTRIRNIQSVTKSVTSLVVGVLHDEGLDLDEPLGALLDPSTFGGDPRARDITLRHLLTMRSGLDLNNDTFSRELLMRRRSPEERWMLSRPMLSDPGTRFDYKDADPQLLSRALQARTGRTLDDLAREKLFDPLGIATFHWERSADGVTLGAHALWLRPRDLARIGQMVLDGGVWEGRRIVSAEWIARSTAPRVPGTVGGGLRYGYYWWIAPSVPGFSASGHGGQFILVRPGDRVVAVLTGLPDVNDDKLGNRLDRFAAVVEIALRRYAAAPPP